VGRGRRATGLVEHLAASDRIIAIVAIRGSSFNGFHARGSFGTFCAGASRYGIGDLETLARDTQIQSRYLDRLIGPIRKRAICISNARRFTRRSLTCPVVFFKDSEDRVVPNQAGRWSKHCDAGNNRRVRGLRRRKAWLRQTADIRRALE
jgi:hypothetical protein